MREKPTETAFLVPVKDYFMTVRKSYVSTLFSNKLAVKYHILFSSETVTSMIE